MRYASGANSREGEIRGLTYAQSPKTCLAELH